MWTQTDNEPNQLTLIAMLGLGQCQWCGCALASIEADRCRYGSCYTERNNWRNKINADLRANYLDEIAERCNYICQICLLPVDMNLRWPNPEMSSIDHRIAHSRGGSDELDNLDLAHFRCNCRKGDR